MLGQPSPNPSRPRYAIPAIFAFGTMVVCTNVAGFVWATWQTTRPEALIALSSRNRFLVPALANDINLWAYATIAPIRIGLAAYVCHLLGRAYQHEAIDWFVRYLGVSRSAVNQMTDQLDTAELFLVPFFVGSNLVWALTGIARTSWRRLVVLASIGIAGRLALIWWLSERFSEQLDWFVDFTRRYQTVIVVVSVALVLLGIASNVRKGRQDLARSRAAASDGDSG